MSRKSKRRRNRFDPAQANAPIESAAFEFVDDRATGATAADFVVTGGAAPAAPQPENAASKGTAGATAAAAANPVAAPAPSAVQVEPAVPVAPVVPQRSLGEVLAQAREARGLTLEEASARTRISIPTLRHLEGDRFDEMVAAAYARGFLRNYGSFLRLDPAMLLQQYDAVVGKQVESAPEVWEHAAGKSERSTPRWAAWVAVAMGIAVAAGGVVYGVRVRQGAPLGTGAGLQQIEEELRASQAPTPEAAPVAPPPPTSVDANAAAAAALPVTNAPVPEAVEAANSVAMPVEDTAAPAQRAATPQPAAGAAFALATPARAGISAETPAAAAPTGSSGELTPASRAAEEVAVASASEGLVLTVTARDSCALRLQIDADARHAQRYHFAHPGETRSWNARRSFRLLVQRGQWLEVRLNGTLIHVPEGRTLVLDRSALAPAVRPARRSKKSRPATVAKTPPPAAANATTLAPTAMPPHAAGPPPR